MNKEDEIDMIKKLPIKDRSNPQHFIMIKYYKGVREYLLSMGEFKDIEINSKPSDNSSFTIDCYDNTCSERTDDNKCRKEHKTCMCRISSPS